MSGLSIVVDLLHRDAGRTRSTAGWVDLELFRPYLPAMSPRNTQYEVCKLGELLSIKHYSVYAPGKVDTLVLVEIEEGAG